MKTQKLAAAAICTALTAVAAQISVPLPFTPVPFSMSVFAVYLTGALLPVREAALAQVCYLLLGIAGLPVFAGFGAGVGVLAGPTGGFLAVYPIMSALVALACRVSGKRMWLPLAAGMLCALAVCYLGGSLWFCVSAKVSWQKALALAVVPFLPMDLVKIAVCVPLAARARQAVPALTPYSGARKRQ